jgi:hypothetical protein
MSSQSTNCNLIDFNRKYIQLIIEKKQLINYHWTSASKLYNYLNDEPLLDWLNMYGKKKGFKTDEEIDYEEYCINLKEKSDDNHIIQPFDEFLNKNYEFNFMKYILKQGEKYEEYVYDQLKQKYKNNVTNIDTDYGFQKFEYNKKLETTRNLINQQFPIICQGLVCDPDTKTFGFPDLIVREDFLSEMFKINLNESNVQVNNENKYNYFIVDIKFHSLNFKKNSFDLIADQSQQHYISQLYIYTKGLRHLIEPDILKCDLLQHKSYVIGRSWNINNDIHLGQSVGCINLNSYENTINKLKDGLLWFKQLKHVGMIWDPYYPHIIEMYPNMNNEKDNNWRKTKKMLSERLGELTMIWNIRSTVKQKAHKNKIYSWRDFRFNIHDYTLDTETTRLIKSIIDINNQTVKLYDFDKSYISNKLWKEIDGFSIVEKNSIVIDGFIDIENTLDIRSIDTPKQDSIIYMIGLYYNCLPVSSRTKSYKSNMTHKTFCIKTLEKDKEKEMIEDFLIFLKNYNCDKHIIWRLYHYSGVEKYTLNKLMEKYNITPEMFGVTIIWIDLCNLLIEYKFVFKNCFDYSLKSINNILHSLGHIPDDCIYQNSLIKNGLDSIVAVFKCDKQSQENNCPFSKNEVMDEISYYNMIDCVSLYHIREFLNLSINSV